MESLINELKEKKVLRKEDIIALRNNINESNPYANSRKKASLLSFAIYKTIDKNLEGFSDKYKQKIRQRLIKVLAYDNNQLIDKSDIFFACTSLEENSNELLDDLTTWVNNSVKSIIKKEVINDYIKSNSEIAVVDLRKSNSFHKNKKSYNKLLEIKKKIFHNKDKNNSFFRISIALLLVILVTIRFATILQNHFNHKNEAQQAFKTNNEAQHIFNTNTIITSLVDLYNLVVSLETIQSLNDQLTSNEFSHIPFELRYRNIDENKLKDYLKTRNSILEEEPYFSVIISTAKDFNLNPIALFSITGQEQGFVPRDHTYAEKIANNPFNVFGSWKEYNSDIKNSTEIAARTVSNLLKGRPEDVDSFQWINRKYAEDKNWWVGVRFLFNQIKEAVE